VIVDVVFVNSVLWAEGWEGGERGKAKGWDSCYQRGDQSGGGFSITSKKLALQVSRFLIIFARGSIDYMYSGRGKYNSCFSTNVFCFRGKL
jgi:hypothetical protein